ncbi:MAG: OadG family protein [Lachnospiraceae bacterium]|nr:OadG family protein [Lachnospiraceae bacterium]
MVYTYLAAAAETSGFDLAEALRNTAVGMGTVFVILILLSGVIALFRFIPNTDKKPAAKVAPVKAAPVVTPAAPETVEDDTQLIAVITAAIAASMGTTSTNGFVVRSVRRVGDSRWKKS